MPRPHRFTETSAAPKITDLARTFYSDSQLDERMSHVRQTIVQVRQCWEAERRNLAVKLLHWLEEQANLAAQMAQPKHLQDQSAADWEVVLQRWRFILSADRNWADLRPAESQEEPEFLLLREYTEDKSYQLVFSRVLQALRSGDDSQVLLLVYLIELINIDLFNYSRTKPQSPSRAYRGLALYESEWLSYRKRLELPVASRYLAVPLALTSASKSPAVALEFMVREAAAKKQLCDTTAESGSVSASSSPVPCLLVFHLLDVSESLMELYRRRFPQSVVSTICVVDISEVSAHPDEQEVLLRGAFYQILDIRSAAEYPVRSGKHPRHPQHDESAAATDTKANVIEMLVISANRDHLSNGRLGDQETPARAIFAAIVRVTRYGYCLEFCRERGLSEGEIEYAAAMREAEAELQRLLL